MRYKYTWEYREGAVKFWVESGRKTGEIAKQLGIDPPLLAKWHRKLEQRTTRPAQRPSAQAQRLPGLPADPAAEIARLKREYARLKMERDILKKAVGIFSEMPK
jgi:transposase